MLIPEAEETMNQIRSRLPQVEVLQAFVGINNRTLCSPVGALPATIVPYRITLVQRKGPKFWCLGTDDRTRIRSERKYAPITQCEILLTVFARPKGGPVNRPVGDVAPTPEPPMQAREGPLPEAPGESSETAHPPSMPIGWAPPPTPIHGPCFRALSHEEQTIVIRAHKNLGHPAPLDLARHLEAAKADKRIVDAAKDFQCDACLESTAPRHQRPGKLHEPKEFNDVIGLDGFYFQSRAGYRAYVLHVLDESSCFHMAKRVPPKHASEATKFLEDMWLSWAGNPQRISRSCR